MTTCSYTDKSGCMRGCIKNSVMQIWHKKGGLFKKEFCLTIPLKDIIVSVKNKGGFIPPYFCEIIFPESNRALTSFGKTLQSLEGCYDKRN